MPEVDRWFWCDTDTLLNEAEVDEKGKCRICRKKAFLIPAELISHFKAEEREACATLCDAIGSDTRQHPAIRTGAVNAAMIIRARGQQPERNDNEKW